MLIAGSIRRSGLIYDLPHLRLFTISQSNYTKSNVFPAPMTYWFWNGFLQNSQCVKNEGISGFKKKWVTGHHIYPPPNWLNNTSQPSEPMFEILNFLTPKTRGRFTEHAQKSVILQSSRWVGVPSFFPGTSYPILAEIKHFQYQVAARTSLIKTHQLFRNSGFTKHFRWSRLDSQELQASIGVACFTLVNVAQR